MISKLLLLSVLGLSLIPVETTIDKLFQLIRPQFPKPTPKNNNSQYQLIVVQGDFVLNNVNTSGGTSSYKFYYTNDKTWKLAQQTCQKEKANLTIINTQDEGQVLINAFKKIKDYKKAAGFSRSKLRAWIGIRKSAGDWVTINGQYVPESKLNWAKIEYNPSRVVREVVSQPDDRNGNQDCVALVFDNAPKLGLIDDDCFRKLPFVCEKFGKLKY